MMPRTNPVHVPSHLVGEADPDTLSELVRTGRRMGHFWPRLAVEEPAREPRRGPGVTVSPRSAALLDDWLERED
jgi:hypothetical protein